LLRSFGYGVIEQPDGWIAFTPDGRVVPFEVTIPGDISSAAFLVGAAVLADQGELRLEGVGVNPTRDGVLRVLQRMGATIERHNLRETLGEPVADLLIGPARLRATEVGAIEIPGLIDEIPILAALASRAEGITVFHQVGELRVKESDRLALLARNLMALGTNAWVEGDDLLVEGTDRPPVGPVITEGDHRIAMAFAILGLVRHARVRVDDLDCAAVSFPGFRDTVRRLVKKGGR
jgi:3-phosphoshikimate 1-carboxyvinyltransferase